MGRKKLLWRPLGLNYTTKDLGHVNNDPRSSSSVLSSLVTFNIFFFIVVTVQPLSILRRLFTILVSRSPTLYSILCTAKSFVPDLFLSHDLEQEKLTINMWTFPLSVHSHDSPSSTRIPTSWFNLRVRSIFFYYSEPCFFAVISSWTYYNIFFVYGYLNLYIYIYIQVPKFFLLISVNCRITPIPPKYWN